MLHPLGEEHVVAMLESMGEALYTLDQEWRFTYINRRCEQLWGQPRSFLLGRVIWEAFPQLIGTRSHDALLRAVTEQHIVVFETISPIVNRWVEVHIHPSERGVAVYFHDVHDRKLAADRALEHAANLQAIMTALSGALTPESVADVILEHIFLSLGVAAAAVRVVTDDGQHLRQLRAKGYPEEWLRANQQIPLSRARETMEAIRAGQPIFLEDADVVVARYPDYSPLVHAQGYQAFGVIPLQVNGRVTGSLGFLFTEAKHFSEADRAFVAALAQQCALALDRARLYAAEQQARAEAEAALRLRDQFLALASHELKTPLTSLMGNAQLVQRRLQRSGALTDNDARYLSVVVEQAGRLNRMISALLDVSRIDTGQLSIERAPLDLGALVRRVVNEARLGLARHDLVYQPPNGPLMIVGDELRLEQALQNLIQNAVKYSPQGGTISVRVERQAEWARVSVIDQGIGISTEAQQRLFQRFYRADNAEAHHISGMGIGLYVVKEIVSLHGGAVSLESQEGQGSTFFIYLPLPDI